jgi:hypothetical protein
VTFAELNVVLAAIVMSPDEVLPNWIVVAFRNGLALEAIARAELEAPPRTIPRPEVLGEITTRPLEVAATSELTDTVSDVMVIRPPETGAETVALRDDPPDTIRISPDDLKDPEPELETKPDALRSKVADWEMMF